LAKRCSFCAFASDDAAAFGEHMRGVHQWDRLASAPPDRVPSRLLRFALGGGVLAVAALYVLVWNIERSCLSASTSAGWCGDAWFLFFFGVVPIAAIGIGIGAVLGHRERVTRPKVDV
jgi:hypothetical protein